jgi:hypothetical protein
MGAVLIVDGRLELLGCNEVLLIEQGLKRLRGQMSCFFGVQIRSFRISLVLPPALLALCQPGIEIMLMLQKLQKKRFDNAFPGKASCAEAEGSPQTSPHPQR